MPDSTISINARDMTERLDELDIPRSRWRVCWPETTNKHPTGNPTRERVACQVEISSPFYEDILRVVCASQRVLMYSCPASKRVHRNAVTFKKAG